MRKKGFTSRGAGTKTLTCHVCNKTQSQVDIKADKVTCWKCVSRASNPNSLFNDEVKPEDFARLVLGKK